MLSQVIHWIPRVISLGMAGFCYFFMLELSSEGWQAALSHFIQGTLLLALALVSWKWGIPGGIVYIALGLYILLRLRRKTGNIVISSVLMITGLLFILF